MSQSTTCNSHCVSLSGIVIHQYPCSQSLEKAGERMEKEQLAKQEYKEIIWTLECMRVQLRYMDQRWHERMNALESQVNQLSVMHSTLFRPEEFSPRARTIAKK